MDEKKRGIYDKYGSFGLYVAEQIGDDNIGLIDSIMFFKSIWFKVSFVYLVIDLMLNDFKMSHIMTKKEENVKCNDGILLLTRKCFFRGKKYLF